MSAVSILDSSNGLAGQLAFLNTTGNLAYIPAFGDIVPVVGNIGILTSGGYVFLAAGSTPLPGPDTRVTDSGDTRVTASGDTRVIDS